MQTSSKNIITDILSSEEFKDLLSEEVTKQLKANPKTQNSEQSSKIMQISDVIAEISQNLEQIVSFNIREALEQEYGLLLEQNGKIKNDIEDIKQNILKMSIKNTGKNILDMKPAQIDSDFNDLEQMLENHSKIGSKQYTKIKKQIDSIKLMLLRFTNTGNIAILEEIDPDKKKKFEQRLGNLGKDVNQLLQNSSDGGKIAQTIALQTCVKDIQEVVEKQKKFQTSIMQKYETSLKSVWNVITMMQANIEDHRSMSDNQSPLSRK